MKGISVVRMTEEHIPAAVQMASAYFSEPWSYDSFRVELDSPHAIPLIALKGREIAGFLCGVCVCGEATLNLIAVRTEFRRRGIGEALLGEMLLQASQMGAERCFLEVRESNLPAQRLYARFGFTAAGRRNRFYKNPAEDALVLTAALNAATT